MRVLFLMLLLSNCFYLGAQDFENNFAWKRVRVKDKFGCVRENGDTIIKPKYKTIEPCYDLAEFAAATTVDGRTILVQVGGQEYNYAATFAELSPKTEAFILTEERSLRSVIKKAPNLKILVFYTQYVSEIPKEIEQLTQLTYLKAMHWGELQSLDNILVSIHANIGKLKKLKHLNLDIPNAASIPSPSRLMLRFTRISSLRWFRYYPSRLRCFAARIGALCAPLVSSMLVSSIF